MSLCSSLLHLAADVMYSSLPAAIRRHTLTRRVVSHPRLAVRMSQRRERALLDDQSGIQRLLCVREPGGLLQSLLLCVCVDLVRVRGYPGTPVEEKKMFCIRENKVV